MFRRLLTIFSVALVLTVAGVISYTYLEHNTVPEKITTKISSQKSGTVVPEATAQEKNISAPGPLRVTILPNTPSAHQDILSAQGVIKYTNEARSSNGGLPALTENDLLDRDAEMKLDDMFAKQYFEHISPMGIGPGDLAKTVGYEFVVVGENLALGDFRSDQELVTAWMNSPGHRANILNTHFEEIGVAVKQGIYEGHKTWIGVQSFGMPQSACPSISTELKKEIDINTAAIEDLSTQLDARKAQINAMSPRDPNYNTYVNEFNAMVSKYNTLVQDNRALIADYNTGVRAFNDCINVATTH